MPNRILRDWTDSEKVNALSVNAERFFVRLIMKVDDFGRLCANVKLLRPSMYPLLLESVREADLQRWIAECEKSGLIRLYTASGKQYLEIADFRQRTRADFSKCPDPDVGQVTDTGPSPDSQMLTYSETETETDKDSSEVEVPPREQAEFVPEFPNFPTNGHAKFWCCPGIFIQQMREAYPGVDIIPECKKALLWCIANPRKRKTPRGMPAFLQKWMERVQNAPARPVPKQPEGFQRRKPTAEELEIVRAQ